MSTQITTKKHRRPRKNDLRSLITMGLLLTVVVVLAAGLFWMLTSPKFLIPGR
jgi:hypothetical protein